MFVDVLLKIVHSHKKFLSDKVDKIVNEGRERK